MLRTTHVATMMLFLSQLDVEANLNLTRPPRGEQPKEEHLCGGAPFHAMKCRDQTHMHRAQNMHEHYRCNLDFKQLGPKKSYALEVQITNG